MCIRDSLNLRCYWTKVHAICTRCRGIIGTIKLLIHYVIFQYFLKCQGAECRPFRQFCPKLVAMATSLKLRPQNLCQFYNLHTCLYHSWKEGEDRFSSCWDIRRDRPFFVVSSQKYKFLTPQSLTYWTKVHHICTRCRGIISAIKLLIRIVIFQSVLKCQGVEWRSFRQFCPKLVAMATYLEDSEKLVRIDNVYANTFHLVKKIVKIGPVDREIALLNLN